jgi:hypothetical protein
METLREEILTLNAAFNDYNDPEQVHGDFLKAQKALYFAICTEGVKNKLVTYKVNLEKRIFEELFSSDFFEIMREAKWLKGQRLEEELLSNQDKPLSAFGIAEEVDGHQTKTSLDLYHWIEQNIEEMRALFKNIRKLTFKLPPESFAAVYEKQSKMIDMEWVENFFNDKMLNVGKLTFEKGQAFRTRAVAEFINKGLLRYAYKPTTEEIAEVDFERVKRELPPDFEFKDFFVEHCAIFKKMSKWVGKALVIDIENYGKYICLHMSKMTEGELLEFFKLEKLLKMINEAIMKLPSEDEPEVKNVAADDDYFVEKLGDALNEVETYMWGQSSHAVLFCALRDNHGFTDNMSRYERIHKKLSEKRKLQWPCPEGTLRVAFSNNSYYKVPVTRWKDMDVPKRAITLLDKFEAIFD